MLHLCCLCVRASEVLGHACQSCTTTLWAGGPSGRGVLWGATCYRTCGPTGARNMTFGARALGYLAVPQQIGYPGS